MPDPAPTTIDHSHVAPKDVPRGATHFRLRKGGSKGTDCIENDSRGVQTETHPIDHFEVDYIVNKWGHCAIQGEGGYAVCFLKAKVPPPGYHPLGPWKTFGLESDVAIPEEAGAPVTELVPRQAPEGGMQGSLMALSLLKDIASKDTEVQVSAHRTYAEAALQATRESNTANLQIMTTLMTTMLAMNRPAAPSADPALTAVLTQLAQGQQQIAKLLAGEEEEEEEEEEDDLPDFARYARFIKDIRENGSGAIFDFIKKEGAVALIEAWPAIKMKLPEMIPMIKPMIDGLVKSALGPPAVGQAAPQVQTFAPPIIQAPRAAPRPAPNGNASYAPPAPELPAEPSAEVE